MLAQILQRLCDASPRRNRRRPAREPEGTRKASGEDLRVGRKQGHRLVGKIGHAFGIVEELTEVTCAHKVESVEETALERTVDPVIDCRQVEVLAELVDGALLDRVGRLERFGVLVRRDGRKFEVPRLSRCDRDRSDAQPLIELKLADRGDRHLHLAEPRMDQSSRTGLFELMHERLSLLEIVAADDEALERDVSRRAAHVLDVGSITLRVLMHDSATADRDARSLYFKRHAPEGGRLQLFT